jgi:hypothetical protein
MTKTKDMQRKVKRLAVSMIFLLVCVATSLVSLIQARAQLDQQEKQIQILMRDINDIVAAHNTDLQTWKVMLESIKTEQKEILAVNAKAEGRWKR